MTRPSVAPASVELPSRKSHLGRSEGVSNTALHEVEEAKVVGAANIKWINSDGSVRVGVAVWCSRPTKERALKKDLIPRVGSRTRKKLQSHRYSDTFLSVYAYEVTNNQPATHSD